jgi:hypothetical protein
MSRLNYSEYYAILEGCLAAWNRGDAKKTAAFYAEQMDYRDPNLPNGIKTRALFERYLRMLFKHWPIQEWNKTELIPHVEPGKFSACYSFRIANPKLNLEIKGTGMDRLEFKDQSIALNWVFLNAAAWPRWLSRDLEQLSEGAWNLKT